MRPTPGGVSYTPQGNPGRSGFRPPVALYKLGLSKNQNRATIWWPNYILTMTTRSWKYLDDWYSKEERRADYKKRKGSSTDSLNGGSGKQNYGKCKHSLKTRMSLMSFESFTFWWSWRNISIMSVFDGLDITNNFVFPYVLNIIYVFDMVDVFYNT